MDGNKTYFLLVKKLALDLKFFSSSTTSVSNILHSDKYLAIYSREVAKHYIVIQFKYLLLQFGFIPTRNVSTNIVNFPHIGFLWKYNSVASFANLYGMRVRLNHTYPIISLAYVVAAFGIELQMQKFAICYSGQKDRQIT
jgi:hypothetical protein